MHSTHDIPNKIASREWHRTNKHEQKFQELLATKGTLVYRFPNTILKSLLAPVIHPRCPLQVLDAAVFTVMAQEARPTLLVALGRLCSQGDTGCIAHIPVWAHCSAAHLCNIVRPCIICTVKWLKCAK